MPNVMMKLGNYEFSVETAAYEQLTRTTRYRWEKQDHTGVTSAMQYLGPGTDEISLNGVIYTHYKGGLGQINAMRAQASTGLPLELVNFEGKIHGRWIINEIEEQQTVFDIGGQPLKQTFRLRISAYGETS